MDKLLCKNKLIIVTLLSGGHINLQSPFLKPFMSEQRFDCVMEEIPCYSGTTLWVEQIHTLTLLWILEAGSMVDNVLATM